MRLCVSNFHKNQFVNHMRWGGNGLALSYHFFG